MKEHCEICGKPTEHKISDLEMRTWEFPITNNKDIHSICFECFDNHTDKYIARDFTEEQRMKNIQFSDESIKGEIEEILRSLES